MRVELLVIPDCPNEVPAREVLAAAAALAGVADLQVTVTVIDTAEEARRRGFVGSPTFLVEGFDPFAVPGTPAGLACRVYPTGAGLSGVPAAPVLRDALIAAGAGQANAMGDR